MMKWRIPPGECWSAAGRTSDRQEFVFVLSKLPCALGNMLTRSLSRAAKLDLVE